MESSTEETLGQFDARSYFASHNPRHFRRAERRQMTPRERAIFEKAMTLFRSGVPLEKVEAMVRKEVAK